VLEAWLTKVANTFLAQEITDPMVVKTSPGRATGNKLRPGTISQVVTARDSQYVGRGSYDGTGLDLIVDLGLVCPMTSTAIRLWKTGFISRSYLLRFQKARVYNPGTSSYILR
jgi:hypothetical protein